MNAPVHARADKELARGSRAAALPHRKLQQTPPWGLFAVVASGPFGVGRSYGAARPLLAARPFWRLEHV